MERNVTLEEISDGKRYDSNDIVRAGCSDCKGCSDCCRGMGASIVLDPYDLYRLKTGIGKTFEQLLTEGRIELSVVEGIILPHLTMTKETDACSFLDGEGRCSIHDLRPGICRLFPLGRIYEENSFKYFLQVHECSNKNRTKVKVKKWVDTPNLEAYERYICKWHYFLKGITAKLTDETLKKVNMLILNYFFVKTYDTSDFYVQFEERFDEVNKILGES